MKEYMKRLRELVGHEHVLQCGASVILINEKGEMLLQKRRDNGCWGYAGGAVELGENTEVAARRELLEETGLIADKLELYGVFSGAEQHYIYPNGDEVSNVAIVYVCREYHGELKCQESEVLELRYFPLDALPDNLSPPVANIIRKYAEEHKPCKIVPHPISPGERHDVNAYLTEQWGSTDMVLRGGLVDLSTVDGFVMTENGAIVGLITYIISDGVCEITSLNSEYPNRGIGTVLIEKVIDIAKNQNCHRVQLMTTNDNINAIKFYQKRGFDLFGIGHGAIDEERQLKPIIPLLGEYGIPLHHEVEFVMEL